MKTTAQDRSVLNKLHEWGNLPGKATEKIFNPEFQKVMDSLRSVDADIRSIVGGKSIDNGDSGNDDVSMKNLIKESRKNFNRREYMTAVAYLGRFHKKLNDIVNRVEDLNVDVNQVHEDFLFKDLDDDHLNYLKDLKTRFANMVVRESLFKEAGIRDLLHNVFDDRGRALAAWEKRYPKQVNKLKRDTENILNKSEAALKFIMSSLKVMGSHRASRKPDPYLKSGLKIKVTFDKYHSMFQKYYEENIKGFLDNQQFADPPSEKPEAAPAPDVSQKEDHSGQEPETSPIPLVNRVDPISETKLPNSERLRSDILGDELREHLKPPAVPHELRETKPEVSLPDINMPSPPTSPDGSDTFNKLFDSSVPPAPSTQTQLNEIELKSDVHSKFIAGLESLSDENPSILAAYIKRYASSIKSTDQITSSRLNVLAKKIIG